ncbi:MAG: putative glycoside hydrolase [Candidatus Magasanikbacteria bacterium]|nr:putative glycoside hydrolase [Candidatus Magasanikbacteria bacterium]
MYLAIAALVLNLIANLFLGLFLVKDSPTYQIYKHPAKIEVKGIYLTAYTAGNQQRRAELVDLVQNTELNALVIDLKDYSGRIFYDTKLSLAQKIGSPEIRIPDLANWIKDLKKQGIYTIARIVVFQDPYLASKMSEIALKDKSGGLWRDYKGLAWVDPTQKLVWDYNLDLAKEAVSLGFDEVNFDYIRFPSDGNIKTIVYANLDNATYEGKALAMQQFYEYLHDTLEFYPVFTSADLFGMVLWRSDGLNIGQRFEDAAPNFDYICPMVYPSHYPTGFEGFANPAQHPYEIVYKSLIRAEEVLNSDGSRAKLRPWLQDFDLGAVYTPEMIELQKQASYDASSTGWLMWNASNRYTAEALELE